MSSRAQKRRYSNEFLSYRAHRMQIRREHAHNQPEFSAFAGRVALISNFSRGKQPAAILSQAIQIADVLIDRSERPTVPLDLCKKIIIESFSAAKYTDLTTSLKMSAGALANGLTRLLPEDYDITCTNATYTHPTLRASALAERAAAHEKVNDSEPATHLFVVSSTALDDLHGVSTYRHANGAILLPTTDGQHWSSLG